MNFKVNNENYLQHQVRVSQKITTWSDKANCKTVGPNSFYDPEDSVLKQNAIRHCYSCPVQKQCLYTALVCQEDYGVWGGFTPRQRRIFWKKFKQYLISKGLDPQVWNSELEDLLFVNSQIQKAAEILQQ